MGLRIVLASIEVDDSLDDFIPVRLVLRSEMLSQFNHVCVELFDTPVNIGFFWVGY